jgi:NAD(P)-dependent dehydrogenase (short-subunit alcohol dehydrogenase family)
MIKIVRTILKGAAVNAHPHSVVVTGASRGLGLASAVRLHRQGWHVVGAMRSPEAGLERIRAATGAAADDPRLTAVRLDLQDHTSIEAAAKEIGEVVGAPDVLVHNAGIVSVGCVEEMPAHVFEEIFATNVFGAVRLTRHLLPSMRAAGGGRIVVVSSESGVHGMPSISAYSASKAALERWAEALALEVAPFGIGVTVLVTGTFKTDVLDRAHTTSHADPSGPYAHLHAAQARLERRIADLALPPERFAAALARAVEEEAAFARHAVGPDARAMVAGRWLTSARLFSRLVSTVLRIPRPGALRDDPVRLRPVHGSPEPMPPERGSGGPAGA